MAPDRTAYILRYRDANGNMVAMPPVNESELEDLLCRMVPAYEVAVERIPFQEDMEDVSRMLAKTITRRNETL